MQGELLFTIKSFIENSVGTEQTSAEAPIHLLQIYSAKVRDQYGIRVGNRVRDITAKRDGDLKFGAGHFDVYLGEGAIFYNIATESEWSPEGFTIEDAVKGNWRIGSISWPGPAWE